MLSIWLRRAIEAVVLLLVGAAPWLFGSVHPIAELLLFAGVFVIAVLWALRIFAAGHPLWQPSAVASGLAALCLLAMIQIVSWSPRVLSALSPDTVQLRQK